MKDLLIYSSMGYTTRHFVLDCIKSIQLVYQNRTHLNNQPTKRLIVKPLYFGTDFVNRIERDPLPQYLANSSFKINRLSDDKELSKIRDTDSLEK